MADIEFFFDPVCPWAWITSRWVCEVADQRQFDVDWRFICLRFVNEHRDYEKEFRPGYEEGHNLGKRLLRAAAAQKAKDAGEVARLYTLFGNRLHVEGRRGDLMDPDGLRATLEEDGFSEDLAAAAYDDGWDEPVRADTEAALTRVGRDVGTPIITFGGGDGPSFFGPVISRIPRGAEAVELWDAVERVACFPGFSELKRSLRERPQTS
jgi:2-hydroxychromene-2-carboxylate isomerase